MFFGVSNYPSFVLAVLVFLAIPGPGLLGILAATGNQGRRAGVLATAGVVCGDWVHMLLAALGVAALLQANPTVFKAIQYGGAAYLIYLGIGLLRTRRGPASASASAASAEEVARPGLLARPFTRLFLVTLMNPKAIVFYMAFFPLFIDRARHHGAATLLLMALTVSALTLLFCCSCVLAVHQLARRFKRNGRLGQLLQRAAGVFLIGFGVKLTTAS